MGRKNFPDKARKLRQFSNLRQMRIKGGFGRFWIIQLHFLDDLEVCLDNLESFRMILKVSGYAHNLAKPLFMRICRKFEN